MSTTKLSPDISKVDSQQATVVGRAARVSLFFSTLCLILIVALHFIKTEFPPAAHMLSEYAIGDYGWVMKLAFFSWSASCLSIVLVVHSFISSKSGKVGLALLGLAGFALILGGLFVIDSPYDDPPIPTKQGALHGLSAMIGLPGQAIAGLLVSYSLIKNSYWQSARKSILLFAHLTWISLVLMFASTFIMFSLSNGKFNGDTQIGWFNRFLVLMYCSWLITVARHALNISKNSNRISKQ